MKRTTCHRLIASTRIVTAHSMMITVKVEFTYPCTAVSDDAVSGMKLSVIFSHPATSVVVETKSIGIRVTQTYFTLPALMMALVATARATPASN